MQPAQQKGTPDPFELVRLGYGAESGRRGALGPEAGSGALCEEVWGQEGRGQGEEMRKGRLGSVYEETKSISRTLQVGAATSREHIRDLRTRLMTPNGSLVFNSTPD